MNWALWRGWLVGPALFFILSLASGQSDVWKVQHLTPEKGLSNRHVNCILQDSRGFTWIGTNFGLNRYDGHRIDVLTRESHHLSINTISNLYTDIYQQIWVIQRQADPDIIDFIDILDPISFNVKPLSSYINGPIPFSLKDISMISRDSSGQLYFITHNNTIFRYGTDGFQNIINYKGTGSSASMIVMNNRIYLFKESRDSMDVYSLDGAYIAGYASPPPPFLNNNAIGNNPIRPSEFAGYIKRIGFMNYYYPTWPAGRTENGKDIFVNISTYYMSNTYYTLETDGFTPLMSLSPLDYINVYFGFDSSKQNIWGQDPNGVYVLNIKEQIKRYPEPARLNNNSCFYNDPKGNIWIGTTEGVIIYSQHPTYFSSYLTGQIPAYSCRGFTEDFNGNIYSLSYGLNRIFHPESGSLENWKATSEIIGLSSCTDSTGNIWFGGESDKVYQYTPSSDSLRIWRIPHEKFMSIWSIIPVHTNEIWAGTSIGLWTLKLNSTEGPKAYGPLNGYTILNESTIYHMLETTEGVWLCTDNGLFLADTISGIKEYVNEKNSGLPNNNLYYLHIDPQGIFWLASRGGGLIRWDRSTDTFKSYTISEGLSHNVIYAVLEDDFGFLWLPSDLGLMRFEKETGNCRTFLASDGIPHEEFNRSSSFKDSRGNFYFGGLNGFIVFNPKDLLGVKTTGSPVKLSKFESINEKTGKTIDLTYQAATGQQITLDPKTSSFLIQYTILDYSDVNLQRFAYRIDGLNENWNYVTENFIRINGLKGGKYTIRVKGQSSSGYWSEETLSIPIIIQKPLIVRWYSLSAISLLFIFVVYTFFKNKSRIQRLRLEREMEISSQLRHVDKLKDQFLANTSHELRTPLNGIVGLSESLLEKAHSDEEKEDLELIVSSGRRLSNLVNDILDFSRLKEHDLQLVKRPVDLRTMVDLCLRMNKYLTIHKNLQLINNISEKVPYCLADENRLQQILQNLIANAIKFTSSGTVAVDAQEVDGMIMTSISDTGIGIEKEKKDLIFRAFEQADGSIAREYGGTGLGLSITKYLVELHGGSIGVVSASGKGSIFSFTIPVYHGDVANILRKEDQISIPATIPVQEKVEGHLTKKISSKNNEKSNGERNILVVDDEPVNLKVLQNHLESAGYNVTLAHDGEEALQLLQHGNHFQLVLLDVMMPRIPGYEVCLKIRERYLLTELPVIMVTAKNQVSDLAEGLGTGANDYIIKPFSKDELLARVKTQMDNYDIHVATNRFVPHEFIHSLGRQSIMDLHRGDMVEKNVHVMFSDIRDYTTLAEDMTPRENFQFVNALAGKVGPIVKTNQGIINQYLGDTIMMLFMQKPDHGMVAGIEILRMLSDYNAGREAKSRKPIRLGIGIHSGPLMMGIIGDTLRTDAAVISDTVNTASRMEGLTKYFKVNFIVSGDTLIKLEDRDRFNFRYLGKVQAKGKNLPIDVYECFDGDSVDQAILKKASSNHFHAGMEAYFAKDMVAARSYFNKVYEANPADTTAFNILHKIHGYLHSGIPDGWTGVEVMQDK